MDLRVPPLPRRRFVDGGKYAGSKYAPMLEAIAAMQIGDPPLRWDLPREKFCSVKTRCHQAIAGSIWLHWHDGQLWVVRYA